MKRTLLIILLFAIQAHAQVQEPNKPVKFHNAVKVLNMGTFHMGYTPDATTTEFDEHDQRNIEQVHQIARSIADFKPTIILVEMVPEKNAALQEAYHDYLQNPDKSFKKPTELELLAFEVGRLAGTKKIYGIDYKENYNYRIANSINNSYGIETYRDYFKLLDSIEQAYDVNNMSVLEKIKMTNNPVYKDMLINVNADMLTHISTKGNAEGADEAAKYYHRNLVIYSNLNQVEIAEDDRVFILMGGSHTAFFDMFLKRSPKYELVDINSYLK